MARDPAPPGSSSLLSPAWLLVLAGLGLAVPAWLVNLLSLPLPAFSRLALVVAATLLAVAGVARQLGVADWTFAVRAESAALVSVAGLVPVFCYASMARNWESGQMFFVVVFAVSLVGSILILLPSLLRRIVLTFILFFHFAGLLTTITAVDPPGGAAPWVSKQLWCWVYRPYLSFLYLTNAYHFYSPDPGPPNLLWFAICYDDGSYTWVKLPERANSPIDMHYQRVLALPEHSFSPHPWPVLPTGERGNWEDIYHRRELGSLKDYLPAPARPNREMSRATTIPMIADMEVSWQYRQPGEVSKRMLAAVAKRILQTGPEAPTEGVKKKSVKMYRVTHQLLTPRELSLGISPWKEEKHMPYFMGEFDATGKLLDPRDPFLYWYLPILYVPVRYPDHGLQTRPGIPAIKAFDPAGKGWVLLDSLEMHAAGEIRPGKDKEKN